jgi:hypothetical protein
MLTRGISQLRIPLLALDAVAACKNKAKTVFGKLCVAAAAAAAAAAAGH